MEEREESGWSNFYVVVRCHQCFSCRLLRESHVNQLLELPLKEKIRRKTDREETKEGERKRTRRKGERD